MLTEGNTRTTSNQTRLHCVSSCINHITQVPLAEDTGSIDSISMPPVSCVTATGDKLKLPPPTDGTNKTGRHKTSVSSSSRLIASGRTRWVANCAQRLDEIELKTLQKKRTTDLTLNQNGLNQNGYGPGLHPSSKCCGF